MIIERKKPTADLKKYYTLLLEGGMIAALVFSIVAVKVNFSSDGPGDLMTFEQEEVMVEEIIQTKQIETPPPPPRPPVPVEVPNDEILEDDIIDISADLDFGSSLTIPPPPKEEEEEEPEIFIIVEKEPEMLVSQKELNDMIQYPELARRAGIDGRVVVQFVVDEQGRVVNPQVVRSVHSALDEEALRVIKLVKFKPGMQRGRAVKVQLSQPINFKLAN